ncbi:hypothetical protein ACKUB1_00920 [Methanospirillum stamsii]|uniref:Uncharacterized protein n=1 Tax=Methanospirillum stamsii TaxID=1277351 RepID=A0A2V2N421_9EURY|nr:hypothetical protein [Methanospirillum stamsii]PWR70211.1 hypothetical protein DLD82_16200 [Methanospirillum stamsii]
MTSDQKQNILSALRILSSPGQVIETRIITAEGIGSGYYDNPEKLADAAAILDTNSQIKGIYITLNEVNPALLARRANRVLMRLSKKDATTADQDITHRLWLPIDIDPRRPSGVSSSDPEHKASLLKAGKIAAYLSSVGWPEPLIADSGNGAHLLYRISLPNDTHSRDCIKKCLESLDILFSDEENTVDTANFNAARIWKLYGTTSRKGDYTSSRPHRRSELLKVPETLEIVPEDLLNRLATLYPDEPKETKKQNSRSPEDLGAWLSGHGIGFSKKPYHDGTLYIFDQCPFSEAHQDGAYAIQFGSGAIFAGCHHDSCGGGVQRWKELQRRFDGDDTEQRLKKLRSERLREKAASSGLIKNQPDARISTEAERILRDSSPIRYMLDAFSQDHEGDTVVAECLLMSLASRSVINSKGLHVSITGESGKGKSHTIDTMLSLVPEELRIDGRMSDKALFYISDLKPGSIIALDDVSLSDQMQEILKGVTTSFQRPFRYRTVSKDRTGMTCTIPERCVWWITKVEGAGDDQVFNRMLTCWIDDSEELDQRVLARTLSDASRVPTKNAKVRDEVLIIRQIWRMITPAWVVIPFAEDIHFQSAANRRNPDMLLDLIKTFAILNQFQRERADMDTMPCVTATVDDFYAAARLFDALNGDTGGQITKLTKREASLIAAIQSLQLTEMTIPDLQKVTGWPSSSIHKLLNGYQSRGSQYSGLLEKCPAISFHEQSVTSGENGQMVQRRMKVFVWDQYLYDAWVSSGAVSLRSGTDDSKRNSDSDGTEPDSGPGYDKPEEKISCLSGLDGGGKDSLLTGEGSNEVCEAVAEKEGQSCRSEAAASIKIPKNCPDNLSCTNILRDLSECEAEGELTRKEEFIPEDERFRDYEPGVAEQELENRTTCPPTPIQDDFSGRIAASHMQQNASLLISQVDPHDFSRLDGWPSMQVCGVCGRKPTVYRRKNRNNQDTPDNPDAFLCEGCYNRAVSRYIARLIPLPGVIDTSQMTRMEPGSRCSLCNLLPVGWYDKERQIGLCDSCYERECERKRREEE